MSDAQIDFLTAKKELMLKEIKGIFEKSKLIRILENAASKEIQSIQKNTKRLNKVEIPQDVWGNRHNKSTQKVFFKFLANLASLYIK